MEQRRIDALVAEFIGTFMLVFFIAMILAVYSTAGIGYQDFAVVGLLHAFVLMMLVYTLGPISGAHFNPAVTAALAAVRKISGVDALGYVIVQVAGGIAGASVCKLVVSDAGRATNYGAPAISTPFLHGHVFTAALVEGIGAAVLVWAIMGTAIREDGPRKFAGLVIGATLGFIVMTFGPLTGAGVNPARSFGPALIAGSWSHGFGNFLIAYVVGPLVGGVFGALLYRGVAMREAE